MVRWYRLSPFGKGPRFDLWLSRYGVFSEFDMYKYRPNPFWSVEENSRHKHLGNLERFGTWHPPGPHKTIHGPLYEEAPRFLYEDRPMPPDTMYNVQAWQWEHRPSNWGVKYNLLYGLGWGAATGGLAYGLYYVFKTGKKEEDEHDSHH